jgi:uncharacterized pyridoxamine 5'-phosphate oxidase family protein
MNIYQEVYDAVMRYKCEFTYYGYTKIPLPQTTDEFREQQWIYVAKKLQKYESEEIIKAAQEKYPILQQIFQMNESEVRS